MNLGDRLKIVRGDISQKEFGEKFNITPNTLRRYETGVNPPTTDFILDVCEKYKINPIWLLLGEGPKHLEPDEISDTLKGAKKAAPSQTASHTPSRRATDIQPSQTQIPQWENPDPEMFYYVPMAKAKLSAGGGMFVLTEDISDYYAFRKNWLNRVASSPDSVVLMTVQGRSMEPTIRDKDTVMIDTGRTEIIEGQIYALRLDETIMLKRLTLRPGGVVNVISDNKEEFDSYQANRNEIYVIGQIIFFCRDLVAY